LLRENSVIPALLRHKLTPKNENMEDILTSNVFGLLKYVQPKCGLFKFLARAATIDGNYPLASLVEQDVTVEYRFWPRWAHCEPDVELDIRGESPYLVGIEAKYRSGKSSKVAEEEEDDEEEEDEEDESDEGFEDDQPEDEEGVRDQLANEWKDLVAEASRVHAQPVLIYLTAHLYCPSKALKDSIKHCPKPSARRPQPMICWLSWRELPKLFRSSPDPHLADLAALADEMKLMFFEGFAEVAEIHADWVFQGPDVAI
jgi:hypothetical protein